MKRLLSGLPGIDAGGFADTLIAHFGGLAPAIAASRSQQLSAASGDTRIVDQLRLTRELLLCVMREPTHNRPLIANWSQLFEYLRFDQGYEPHEQARVLFLNAKNYLISQQLTRGSIDEAAFYIRDILRTALEIGASGVILVHNHPSGIAKPSESDVRLTNRFAGAARLLEVRLLDHVIVTREGYFSFREQNLI